MSACWFGKKDAVEMLLKQRKIDLNQKGMYGNTALMLVATGASIHDKYGVDKNYKEIINMLLKHGADINEKNSDGNTALILAAQDSKYALYDLLKGLGANTKIKNDQGYDAAYFRRNPRK